MIGDEVVDTKNVELSAKALPKSQLTKVKTRKEWDQFIERFAKIDKKSGKPAFVSVSGFFGASGTANFAPDFETEVVLILSADKRHKDSVGGFMNIEVFEDKDRLRVFAFFAAQRSKPAPGTDASAVPVAENLYLVSIPHKLAENPIEFRIAHQSWGRVCSKFSPAITTADATQTPPDDRTK